MKVVIIGGVATGASAAARLRRLDENAQIIMLERGEEISFANCGLPYYVGGAIQDQDMLTLQTPQSFHARYGVDVRVRHEVTSIDPARKVVTVRDHLGDREYEESYDKLILSPGAEPIRPPIPGLDDQRVFTLRSIADTLRIHEYIHSNDVKRALVIGGGFIGLEMAENLAIKGIAVTVVELSDHVLANLDYDMSCEVHRYLRKKGLTLHLGRGVKTVAGQKDGLVVALDDGQEVATQMIILAAGVRPESDLAKAAGLACGVRGAVVVNDHLQTSDPDIYAGGDATQVRHFVSGQPVHIPLAGPANKHGRIIADNICGLDSTYKGTQGTSILKLFDMAVATTGLSEVAAKAALMPVEKVHLVSPSHATYYPGASSMSIKVLFDPADGKIIGAQLVGFEGVDKRCDVLATAIRAGMSGQDLTELELAYAPPFSSAKDPVNMAGYMIENAVSGKVSLAHWEDILRSEEAVQILDVREKYEQQMGAMPDVIHIPLGQLRNRLDELDKSRPVYVHCRSGQRSYLACRILSQQGFDCKNISGGFLLCASLINEVQTK